MKSENILDETRILNEFWLKWFEIYLNLIIRKMIFENILYDIIFI